MDYIVLKYDSLEDFQNGINEQAKLKHILHSWQDCGNEHTGWLIVAVFNVR
jgi:hypothetical protein